VLTTFGVALFLVAIRNEAFCLSIVAA